MTIPEGFHLFLADSVYMDGKKSDYAKTLLCPSHQKKGIQVVYSAAFLIPSFTLYAYYIWTDATHYTYALSDRHTAEIFAA